MRMADVKWQVIVEVPSGEDGDNTLAAMEVYTSIFGLKKEGMSSSDRTKAKVLLSGSAMNISGFYYVYRVLEFKPITPDFN